MMNSPFLKDQLLLAKNRIRNNRKALVILIAGLILTVIATCYTQNQVEVQAKLEFSSSCNEIKTKISSRLHANAQLLRTGSALFAASDSVTREDWKLFNEHSEIDKNLPGIQGLGYSVLIPGNQLEQHIQSLRKEGFSNYTVKPSGNRSLYTPVIYIEPFSSPNLNAFGFDGYSEPTRRKAMELARDSDLAMVTGKVILVQESNENIQTGTLMYVPVYRNGVKVKTLEQRRASILGWVYSPYRMNDLMNGILQHPDSKHKEEIHLKIYDDSLSVASLLFDSQGNGQFKEIESSRRNLILPVTFNGKTWVLHFIPSNQKSTFFQSSVLFVLFSGILISVLLFLLSESLFNTSSKAKQIASELTMELQNEKLLLRTVIDNIPDSIYCKDTAFRKTLANLTDLRYMGATSEAEVLGKNDFDFYPRELAESFIALDRSVIQTGKPALNCEELMKDENGVKRWLLSSKIPMRNKKGEITGLLGIGREITDRKHAEEEIKQKNEELQKLNTEKDKLFSIISHDLRSPFNGFLGLTQIMVEELPTLTATEIQLMAESMRKSAINLFRLLENLLEWTRLQQGLIPYTPKVLELHPIVQESISMLLDLAASKEIEIVWSLTDQITILADNYMVQSVIRNLVSNAVKFTNRGGKITLSARMIPDNLVKISVSDTGIGMDKSLVDDLFRLDINTSRKGTEGESSTGLGLIICKDFIEKHHGKLWVESDEGKGSTFYFTIPCPLMA